MNVADADKRNNSHIDIPNRIYLLKGDKPLSEPMMFFTDAYMRHTAWMG